MRLSKFSGSLAIVLIAVAGCGGAEESSSPARADSLVEEEAALLSAAEAEAQSGAQEETDFVEQSVEELDALPSRLLSAELPADDATLSAATAAYDDTVIEGRALELTGLTPDDVDAGHSGQKLYLSFTTPPSTAVAVTVCQELVDYANEIDFPATEIAVQLQNGADAEATFPLASVDASGSCVAADG